MLDAERLEVLGHSVGVAINSNTHVLHALHPTHSQNPAPCGQAPLQLREREPPDVGLDIAALDQREDGIENPSQAVGLALAAVSAGAPAALPSPSSAGKVEKKL